MRVVVAVVVICVGCKRDHPCEQLVDLAAKCLGQIPGATLDEMERFCSVSLREQGAPPGAYHECTKATTCDEQQACFARWDCQFVLTGPNDTTPQFTCALAPR